MIKYYFQINKESCFVYWVQSIVDWNYCFDAKKFEHYGKMTGEFSNKEKEVLKQFKKILQRKPDGGYLWIWNIYYNNPIKNKLDVEIWEKTKDTLGGKFEIIWEAEYPKLLKWKKRLEDYSFENLNDIFLSLNSFFGEKIEDVINVQLNLFHRESVSGGYAKKEFKNLILLNISSLQTDFMSEAINTITHETAHQLDYLSDKNILLKKSFIKIFKPHSFKYKIKKTSFKIWRSLIKEKKGSSWSHLISESIITSIAGTNNRFNYLNQKEVLGEAKSVEKISKPSYKDIRHSYSEQIMTVAYYIKDLTKEYLDNNKEMNSGYTDKVAETWFNFVSGVDGGAK